jgi:Tol biopolymer transport system component
LAATGDQNPIAWSSDGRFIAFWAPVTTDKCGLFLVPALGGPRRKVTEVPVHNLDTGKMVAWHASGKWLAVSYRNAAAESCALFAIPLDGSEKHRLTSPPSEFEGDHSPAFSPDGRALAFTRNLDDGTGYLEIAELTDDFQTLGEPRRLLSGPRYVLDPAWMPDSRSIVFAGGIQHGPSLFRLNIEPTGWRPLGHLERLGFAGEGATQPTIKILTDFS